MPKQDLSKMLSQSAERSTPVEIRRGRGVGLSVEESSPSVQEPQVIWVALDHLLDNPYQHAEEIDADDFNALVESIKLDGFQGALNVSPIEGRDGYYFLLGGGHQRRDAARQAGIDKIPVFVNATPQEKRQLGLRLARENTAQVNRSPVNLGFLYLQLTEEYGMTQEEIAHEIQKDRYHVNFAIMAARSASDIRAALREKYSPRVMTYLRRIETPEERAPIIHRYLAGELTVDGVRSAVEAIQTERKHAPLFPEGDHQGTENTHVFNEQEEISPLVQKAPSTQEAPEPLLEQIRALSQSSSGGTEQREMQAADLLEQALIPEQLAKAQAAFSRIETYRRYIEKKRADGMEVILSDQEATLLGKIVDRCHTLLDTYRRM